MFGHLYCGTSPIRSFCKSDLNGQVTDCISKTNIKKNTLYSYINNLELYLGDLNCNVVALQR